MIRKLSYFYGEVLAEIRKDHDLTQSDVSADTGIDVSKIETGERLVRTDTLHCLGWYYRVHVSDVVIRVERKIREFFGEDFNGAVKKQKA